MSDGTATESTSLPQGWALGTVGDTGQYINGLAFKESDWGDEGLPIIRIQNLTNPSKPFNRTTRQVEPSFVVKRGDILVSWSATLDAFQWNSDDAILNQHIFKVVPDQEIVHRSFLYYLLRHAISTMKTSADVHGSTMKHINRGPFLATQVPLPPLPEQHRIVAAIEEQFTRLDAAVASLERARANLKRYRAAVLAAACSGRLVPTEAALARAEGRQYEDGDRLLERILLKRQAPPRTEQRTHEAALTDADGFPSPEGWTRTTLGGCFEWGSGGTPRSTSAHYYGGDIPWLIIGDLNDGVIHHSRNRITQAGLRESSAKWVEPGSVLLAMYGASIGKLGITGMPLTTNQAIAFTKPDPVSAHYLFYYLRHKRDDIVTLGKGGAQPNISQTVIKSFPLDLPPLAEQHRIVAEVERRLSIVEAMEASVAASLARAERLRQAVLRKAFAGELVPQDPSDEPASVLLERIKAERAGAGTVVKGTRQRRSHRQTTLVQE